MVTVRTTVSKLLEFIKNLQDGTANDRAYFKIVQTLKNSLENNVFGDLSHSKVFEIPTQTDLELLIMAGGRSHRPSQPREAHYSKEYLAKKRTMNLPAHEWLNKGFVEGTEVLKQEGKVLIRTPSEKTTVRGYNYGTVHESKKSVLKYAFLSAWQNIINDIIESYKSELT